MSLDFIWMLGCTVIKTVLIFPGLDAKVGTFGLWRSDMTMFVRVALYALLGYLLGESGITFSQSPGIWSAIILTVILIDLFASKSNV